MDGAVRTMYVFSTYLLAVGVLLSVGPNTLLSLVGLPETNEVWIRILGVVSILLALYYFDAARNNSRSFFAASILGRGFSTAALVLFWATGHPWQLLIFAGVELGGAIWTYTAMRVQAGR
jgi:hypothetical protein